MLMVRVDCLVCLLVQVRFGFSTLSQDIQVKLISVNCSQ